MQQLSWANRNRAELLHAGLEQFTGAGLADNGIAVMLTNERNLWLPTTRLASNDREFHINEGVTLTRVLRWAKDLYPGNTRKLAGSYPVHWNDYSKLEGTHGAFRWFAIQVGTSQKADPSNLSAG